MLNFGLSLGKASSFDPDAYRITKIEETINGSCTFTSGDTCTAKSTLVASTVNAAGAETFTWTLSTGEISSGQGTNTIVASTTADVDVSLIATCEATDTISTYEKSKSITQAHTLDADGNFFLLVDNTSHLFLADGISKLKII